MQGRLRISPTRWDAPFVSPPDRSLYLYFLDRELGAAAGYALDPLVARHAASVLVIATSSRLICGLSLLYENDNLDRRTVGFFSDLLKAGALDVVSHHLTYEEFKASRIAMYKHDAARYPAYFSESDLPVIEPTVQKAGGTTTRIVLGMIEWASRLPEIDPRYRITAAELRTPVLTAIREREDMAVTFSLFAPHLGELRNSRPAETHIRRAISRLFATDYRDFGDNDIPTGVRNLGYFESELARDFPLYDVQILGDIVRLSGFDLNYKSEREHAVWQALLWSRESEDHALYAAAIRWVTASLADVVMAGQGIDRQDEVRLRIRGLLRRLTVRQSIPGRSLSGAEFYSLAAANIMILADQLRADRRAAEVLERRHDEFLPPPQVDVLLVVATEVEYEAVIGIFTAGGYALAGPMYSSTNAYQAFAPVGGARVALVRCSMGPGGSGGPELTVAEGIDTLRPTSVIMAGIAFGIDPNEQKLGDVLLATQVFDYELQRIGADSAGGISRISRGPRPEASPRLISRFQAARLAGHGLRIQEGVLLSGSKLIDNIDYRNSILATCPDSIGGEMEGYGVYAAAARSRTDWIIVKAICDWADGNKRTRKSYRQRLAARNAATAVLRTLEKGGFGP